MKILPTTLSLAGLVLAALGLTAANGTASQPAAVSAPAAVTYTVDSVHSSVVFSTMHLGTSRFYGRFNQIGGTFTVDADKAENSKVSIEIDIGSIDSNNKGRDEHLRGPDFFDAKQFPTAKFESKTVTKSGDKTWKVVGDLTLHGVTKSIVIPMEQTGTGKGREGESLIGFHGTFRINRSDFGIKFMTGGLGEEVSMIVSVEAAAK